MAEDWNAANWVGRRRPALGSGTLTEDQRQAQFDAYVERTADVDGWWLDPAKVAATAAQLGLPAGTAVEVVRRRLFDRRWSAA